MFKVFKYSLYDMVRSRWMLIYFLFFMILSFALLFLSNDLSKLVITLTNVILAITPLIGILFGTMYYYNSEEFIKLLLAQPLSRKSVILGLYSGLAVSLCLSLVAGIGIPMMVYGIWNSPELGSFLLLLFVSCLLTVVFSLIAFVIALKNSNKIRGIGIAMFFWLFFAIIYDGIFLLLLSIFSDYPLEKLTIALLSLNPVDMGRILIMLQLDISALMGYTGAVLQKFLGSQMGFIYILIIFLIWIWVPYRWMLSVAKKKNY